MSRKPKPSPTPAAGPGPDPFPLLDIRQHLPLVFAAESNTAAGWLIACAYTLRGPHKDVFEECREALRRCGWDLSSIGER